MKHEMTAREYAYQRARVCKMAHGCVRCPLGVAALRENKICAEFQRDYPEEAVRLIEEWAAEHPEETLEPLGDNIYFDPKHRIVADEVVRVFTVEITQVGETEYTEEYLKCLGQAIADEFAAKAYPYNIDDVKCVRAQQFITKCHEEEV